MSGTAILRFLFLLSLFGGSLGAAFPAPGTYTFFRIDPSGEGIPDYVRGQMTVTASGEFSAKVSGLIDAATTLNGAAVQTLVQNASIKGRFQKNPETGTYESFVDLRYATAGSLRLTFVPDSEDGPMIVCDVYIRHFYPGGRYKNSGIFSAFKTASAGGLAGQYTAALVPSDGFGPSGAGWAAFVISPAGHVHLRGFLASGRPFTCGTRLRADGAFWFDASRFLGRLEPSDPPGIFEDLGGVITMRTEEPATDADGLLQWRYDRVVGLSRVTFKIHQNLKVVASRYRAPANGEFIFRVPDAAILARRAVVKVTLSGGGLEAPGNSSFSLIARGGINYVRDVAEPLKDVQLNVLDVPSTGAIGGTFQGHLQLAEEKELKFFSGVFLQKQNTGIGFFRGPSTVPAASPSGSGLVTLEPDAEPDSP
jgi:hypothetical protein